MTFSPKETPQTVLHKLASLQSSAWLPPAMLLLALSSVFLFGGSRGYFGATGSMHDQLSAKNMAIVENLSIEHHFLMFIRQIPQADDKPTYHLYSRFPIGSYALIKLAVLPFGDGLSDKIYAARMLMLLFFVAAAVMAYLALARLASSRWIALTATSLAFSSPYLLYYGDAISNETIVDIFGALLVFHGMVVFEQEGRFRQLAVKTCIALLLGWHVYALLMPFIVFGLTRELVRARTDVSTPPPLPPRIMSTKRAALPSLRSRYLALGVIALLFGMSMLTLNFTNEYFALNRETPLTELPSVRSMIYRTGVESFLEESRANHLAWREFMERQFHRIGVTTLPYAFSPSFVEHDHRKAMQPLFVILGMSVCGASLIGLLLVRRHTILLASLALSGFCWALPMRHNTAFPNQTFEALLYIGVALTLFSIVLLWLRKLSGDRLIAALSVAALLIFAFSALRMSQLNDSNQTAELQEAAIADYEVVRSMTDGKTVLVNSTPRFLKGVREVIYYYLAGRPIIYGSDGVPSGGATPDFVVTSTRPDGFPSSTPQNRWVFLYEWNNYQSYIADSIEQTGELLIRSKFDVYLNADALIYVKDTCSEDDTNEVFFLALYPVAEIDLPHGRRQHGFQNLDFAFHQNGIRQRGDRCIAIAQLPDYDIARIYTGQYIQRADGSTEHLWEGEIHFTEAAR